LFSLSGCGYKAPPYYEEEAPQGDENIEFIIKNKEIIKNENNESCE
jgi:predicted small lipoprotein YifL